MSVTVLSIINNVLRDVNLPETTGANYPGLITSADILRYLYEAEQEFNDLVLILRANAIIQATEDRVEYDLPDNFKTNLYNVEYDYKSLDKQSKEFYDLYNSSWRDPSHIVTLSETPKFFSNHLEIEGKFSVWPPPSTDGESQSTRGPRGGLRRTVTFDDTTYNLRGSSGGLVRTLTVDDEILDLRMPTGGLIKTIMPRKNNFYIEYIKEPAAFTIDGNIESILEKYQKVLEDYCKFKIYRQPSTKHNRNEADYFENRFYEKARTVKENLKRARPRHPMAIKPVFSRSQLSTKEVYISA